MSQSELDELSPRTKTEIHPDAESGADLVSSRPFLTLVLAADRPLSGGARFELSGVDQVTIGRGRRLPEDDSPISAERNGGRDRGMKIAAGGEYLSAEHARIARLEGEWTIENLSTRNSVTVNGARIEQRTPLSPGDLIAFGRLFWIFDFDETRECPDVVTDGIAGDRAAFFSLIPTLAQRFEALRAEGPRDSVITLVGETGTGKEVLARALHAASGRRGPYFAVNCAAIPRTLIESELFGHVKAAFSGAVADRPGYIREANGGTFLLDEVIDAPPEVQVALLRVIQEREVMPVGARRPEKIDVRFLAAAQRPLGDAVAKDQFRADLQGRLEGIVFELAPLRERIADIGLLVANMLRDLGVSRADRPRFSYIAADALLRHDWPLNIRELANAVRRGWDSARDGEIREADLRIPIPKPDARSARSRQRDLLLSHLRAAKGNVAETARRMGRTRPTVYQWLRQFDLDPTKFRG